MSISLKSFHVPKESMGYAKKRRKEKISMPKEHEKKMPKSMNNPMLKSMKKRKEKKEKDSPYFQKATIKRESHAQRSLEF